ncbi:Dipeptidyl aminopeptidase/acylaminoacyl peptidase [Chitinophaga rupis]|uniref:Dipeptidyl aminopeptidase/acylaminoacyl peptidase n=2 Tax=Chitinophaga rupis TaxID=573321 RepID=A0A1H7VI98_9BACT|nr:Dipeptidyl aminopeptidase/acylaminoacyl peptidase [Chitinophaga rupis]
MDYGPWTFINLANMKSTLICAALTGLSLVTYAQQTTSKPPLDHSVYDSWESIGKKAISNNGQWIVYTITPQEGDARLVIYDNKTRRSMEVPRGSKPVITEDSRYVIFAIDPYFKDTRQAKIKKKKPAEMPKDSLGIVTLEQWQLWKAPMVKSFKTPAKGSGWVAYLQERPEWDKDSTSGTPLIIRNLKDNKEDTLPHVLEYTFSKPGNKLLAEITTAKKDPLSKAGVLLWDIASRKLDTLSRGSGERKLLTFDDKGLQAAWVSTRDTAKAPQRIFQLYYYKPGQDTGIIAAGRQTPGLPNNWGVADSSNIEFSENGQRLFFGTAPIRPPKDTTLVDFEVAKVDIWNYQDDFLQPMQLKNLNRELKRSYTAVYDPATQKVLQLGNKDLETVVTTDEGNSAYALGYTDKGERIAMQWTGRTLKTAWLLNVGDGTRRMVKEKLDGDFYISPKGQYLYWYDRVARHWFSYQVSSGAIRNITASIPTKMYDEVDDHPDEPDTYGVAGWLEGDKYAYIYDRYDVWQVDPSGQQAPVNVTLGTGRKDKTRFRYEKLDEEERFFKKDQDLLLSTFNETTKYNGFSLLRLKTGTLQSLAMGPYAYQQPGKAKNADSYIFTKSSYELSPDVYAATLSGKAPSFNKAVQLSHINPQQQQYNWGTASLFKWTAYNGQPAEGILYKPEDFDSTKHYPVLIYFYEKLSDGLYNYSPPAPTPSRLNIPFFVSRGYLVFAPDITYENGYPGKSAYNYIVSGARALAQHSWVDSTNMGIQGQSWGGYQVAYLVTQTHLFKAAWAGAPVANMTSAYGGIRWESGMNRQFQYEHTQSRIGATLWEKPELYLENSPLFHLPNVTTPLAIMSNDADGAVPWYQGIELFTGLRRLGKPVWLLNYNNEAHNLVLRQNRKDIQRREQQFFDHFLKGAPAPQWLLYGVPATEKGVNWGWEVNNNNP